MLKVLGKILYIILLIGLMIDGVVNSALPYFFKPEPITPALIVIVSSVGFCITYCLYIFSLSKSAIYICTLCYLLFISWQIGKIYFWPLWHQQEYLIVTVFYLVLGIPIFIAAYSQIKQNRVPVNNE